MKLSSLSMGINHRSLISCSFSVSVSLILSELLVTCEIKSHLVLSSVGNNQRPKKGCDPQLLVASSPPGVINYCVWLCSVKDLIILLALLHMNARVYFLAPFRKIFYSATFIYAHLMKKKGVTVRGKKMVRLTSNACTLQ